MNKPDIPPYTAFCARCGGVTIHHSGRCQECPVGFPRPAYEPEPRSREVK
jgi:hypothetical protein